MGNFLNIICDNLDNLSEEHYVNGKIPTNDERFKYVENILLSVGVKNIRRCNVDDNSENINENFYYFITHVNDLTKFEHSKMLDNKYPYTEHLRGRVRSDSNFHIIFLDEFNIKDSLKTIYDKLFINFDRLIIKKPDELNFQFLDELKVFPKKSFNIVYDRWSEDNITYFANLHPAHKEYFKYKIVVGLFRFYNFFHQIRNCVLDEVYVNSNENFYYFINSDNFNHHVRELDTIPLPTKVRDCFNKCNNFTKAVFNDSDFKSQTGQGVQKIVGKICGSEPDVTVASRGMFSNTRSYYFADSQTLQMINSQIRTNGRQHIALQVDLLDHSGNIIDQRCTPIDNKNMISYERPRGTYNVRDKYTSGRPTFHSGNDAYGNPIVAYTFQTVQIPIGAFTATSWVTVFVSTGATNGQKYSTVKNGTSSGGMVSRTMNATYNSLIINYSGSTNLPAGTYRMYSTFNGTSFQLSTGFLPNYFQGGTLV